jgi:hypothetical protein
MALMKHCGTSLVWEAWTEFGGQALQRSGGRTSLRQIDKFSQIRATRLARSSYSAPEAPG